MLTESALKGGLQVPVHFDLLLDAEHHLFELGDLRRSVIDGAVCCEAFMRQRVAGQLPVGLGATARKHVERANVRPTLMDMFAEKLDDGGRARFDALRQSLDTLFVARNEILHRGIKKDLTTAGCTAFLKSARDLMFL